MIYPGQVQDSAATCAPGAAGFEPIETRGRTIGCPAFLRTVEPEHRVRWRWYAANRHQCPVLTGDVASSRAAASTVDRVVGQFDVHHAGDRPDAVDRAAIGAMVQPTSSIRGGINDERGCARSATETGTVMVSVLDSVFERSGSWPSATAMLSRCHLIIWQVVPRLG